MTIAEEWSTALGSRRGAAAADRLCELCVETLGVDEAAISLIFDGANTGTLGVSSSSARHYDEMQFVLGEGPCLQSVADRAAVLMPDLTAAPANLWPLYTPAMLDLKVQGVYAVPIAVAGVYVGALDLFRFEAGDLTTEALSGAHAAAELAELPLLDLLADDLKTAASDPDSDAWHELSGLTRVEVSQATGMLVGQLDIDPRDALVRLRAHAYATGRTATEVARDILDRRLRLEL